ncbi:diacylglycerol kinase family protein [Parapedobacter sp. 10938]|uniref:diacylglycerol kinase family protein n=1 Tax=Parapedobacter flavus TaxID=3110225 RepID=UPI002DBE45E4|nr:diacylglycerol kinase family protein [Parapedobacter sp. 10938]MEC3881538.1 diacylglycerol kinase family protein [Parapedobacter sp. 10938]
MRSKRKRNPFADAFNGIVASYHSERNLRIHIALALVAIVLGLWLGLSGTEWCWIALCITQVVVAELVNTAIEAWVDTVSPNEHPLAKKAKDAAAGAVLVAATFAVVVGGIILLPKLWTLVVG